MTTTIKTDPALDFAGNVAKLKEQLRRGYDAYCQEREAEGWVGYNTEEAQMEDGWKLGYIAALEDVLHVLEGGTEWRQLLADDEQSPAQPAEPVHFCSNDEHPVRFASHVVLDADGNPYCYFCPACVGVFEDGQEVFDLVIESLEAEKSDFDSVQSVKKADDSKAEDTHPARMVVTIHHTYTLSVDVPKRHGEEDARVMAARITHDMGSLAIATQGKLEIVEVDWPEFQAWEDEDGTETPASAAEA